MGYKHTPATRDVLSDTYTDLKRINESDTKLMNMGARFESMARFAEVSTNELSALKTRCYEIEKEKAVSDLQIKMQWWGIGVLALGEVFVIVIAVNKLFGAH